MEDTGREGVWNFLEARHGGLRSVGSHTGRFTYIAMVEEFSKSGGRVCAHLNAVAPAKIECF